MKIGIDARLWSQSGVGRYTRNLVEQLRKIDKRNKYVLFVRSEDIPDLKSKVLNPKSENWQIVKADIRWHSIKEQIAFPKIIYRENLDLMHFPYFSVPVFYIKPFVITIHDLIINHFPTGQASTLNPLIYKLKLLVYEYIISASAKKAKKIITVSNATKNEIVNLFKINPNKIAVTYEASDEKISNIKNQISKKNLKLNLNSLKYFLYVGNAYPHKNLEILTKAFLKINQNDFKLILVGKDDYFYKRLRQKIGKKDSIVFYGEASDSELANLYTNSLALIIPSLMEGFGLPVLEAMANKCLVLASDIPVLHEIGGDSILYFDPYDINDICKKISLLFSTKERNKELIDKAYERSKEFSWEKMARETLNIYESYSSVRLK